MTIDETVKIACQQPTLVDALSWICDWEGDRAIRQALRNEGKSWDTCYRYCIAAVMKTWKEPQVDLLANYSLSNTAKAWSNHDEICALVRAGGHLERMTGE